MVGKMIGGLVVGLAVSMLSLAAWAEEAKKSDSPAKAGPGGPETPRRGPEAGPKSPKQPGAGAHRAQPGRPEAFHFPDLKALFAKMDKNHDGSLSVDEFVTGMTEMHRGMREHFHGVSAEQPRQPGEQPRQPGEQPRQPGEQPRQPGPNFAGGMGWGAGMGWPEFAGPRADHWRGPMGGPGPRPMHPAGCPCPWCGFGPPSRPGSFGHGPQPWGGGPFGFGGPPWHFAGPWTGAESWAKGPGPGPGQRPPFASTGASDEEHLRRLVAKLVREELDKIVKEKADGVPSRPSHRDAKAEAKK
jgi:hypothetical protein